MNNAMSVLDGDDVSGTHVDVCCLNYEGILNWQRNSTGHTISASGISFEMMEWLSSSMKFEYQCLPQRDSERFTRDNATNTDVWTSLYQLNRGLCRVSIAPFVITYSRFKYYCDFLSPFVYTPYNLLIPVPQIAIGGISSVWRPFETLVWATLLISIAVTMFTSLVNWLYRRNRLANNNTERNKISLELHWLFILGLLLSKAGFKAPDSFKMRLAGGAWCIAALILTNYYSSFLTSLITASSPEPIVNSVQEMANNDKVDLIIIKGFGASAMITDGIEYSNLFKKLDHKLKSSKNSGFCPNQSDCFRQVVSRKTTTFLHDERSLFGLVSEDYHQTGRCNAAFAKEPFNMVHIAWAISKNYSQFEIYQRGILRMMETGLIEHWKYVHFPKPIKCTIDPSSRQSKLADIRNPAIVNLHGLVPAFEFLSIGIILALMVLLAEWMKKVKLWQVLHQYFFCRPCYH